MLREYRITLIIRPIGTALETMPTHLTSVIAAEQTNMNEVYVCFSKISL